MVNPLTLAAAQAAGPVPVGDESAWLARVKQIAVDLTFLDPEIERTLARVAEAGSGFTGTITAFAVNEKSTRGKITLFTGTTRTYEGMPAGHEPLQTERGDTPDGAAQIAQARALIGHRVMVWRVQEKIESNSDGHSFRLLVRLQDLGAAESGTPAQQAPRAAAPAARPQEQEARPAQPQAQQQRSQPVQQPAPAAQPIVAEPAATGWPAVAGADSEVVPVNHGKQILMDAVGGDPAKAKAGWEHIGNPTGPVALALVQSAIAFVQAA